MRAVIYGAGAVGSVIGGYLHNSGQGAILVSSRPHVDAISRAGLTIKGVQGDYRIDVPAVNDIREIELREDDLIFLTMKTFDTEDAIRKLGDAAERLVCVCFQNGVRNEEFASGKFRQVYGGIVFFGAKHLEPGVTIHTADNSLGLGLYPVGLDGVVNVVSDMLTRADFSVTAYPDIMAVKWSKLFRNLSNSLFAITGLTVLEGLKHEKSRLMMADIMEEALRVVQAEGIKIMPLEGHQPPEKMIELLRKPGERGFEIPSDEEMALRPSTWQDLYLKRGRTEVEYLNGEIVQLGEKHGIATPLNSMLVRVVNLMARERIQPGAHSIDALRRMI